MRQTECHNWTEAEWLQQLQRRAARLTSCVDADADLAHDCLCAFWNHFGCYPWEYPDPLHAWRWCCLKLRALACDARRHAQRHPSLSLEEVPESLACVEMAEHVQGDVDGEAFVAQLPQRLQEIVQLRLQGFSWEAIAHQLGVKASTVRGYLPELRARFVAFFGYDPSNRAFESLIEIEGTNSPSVETGGDGDASDGSDKQGFRGDPGSAGGGGKFPTVGSRVCYWMWKVTKVACLIGACLTCGVGGWTQSRLQGVRCDTKATLQVMGRTPDCGFLLSCPYGHHYCSSFWDLCEGQRSRTVILNTSCLILGGGLGGGGNDSWSGGATLNADFTFSFTSPYPDLRIEGYTYTPKRSLGFLYFVEQVHAASFAAASAYCGPSTSQEDGCCDSSSASARVSASIQTALASASVSSAASGSCGCNSECMDCTRGGGGESACDPPDCRGRRAYKANRVDFGRNNQASHEESMTGNVSLGGSSVECGGGASGASVSAFGGLVIQSSPDPLGVPAIGENEYVWTSTTPAELRIDAAAMVHTWGWNNPDTAWLASEVSFSTEPEIPTDYTKPGIMTVARGSLLVAQSEVDGNMQDGLVYKSDRLPPKNSDFGKKKVLFESKQGPVDYAEVEVFYPARATNHPHGEPEGFELEGCRQIRELNTTPNWFYYYWDAYGRHSDVYYGKDELYESLFGIRGLTCEEYESDTGCRVRGVKIYIYKNASPCAEEYEPIPLYRLVERRLENPGCVDAPQAPYITRTDEVLYVYGIHRYIATLEHELAHKRRLLTGTLCRPGRYDPSRVDNDEDGLNDEWELQHGLHPCSYRSIDRELFDREVIAIIEGYGKLLRAKDYWRQDWADCGLQRGEPISPFPWKYKRGSRESNTPYYSDLLVEIPTTR